MGLVFEELIRKFAESSNETAGKHFTPRDIVRLTTALVFVEDDELLTLDGIVRSIYDPTGGTGGMISSGMEYVHELNPRARLAPFGQELNPESYAICKADMLIKGQDVTKNQVHVLFDKLGAEGIYQWSEVEQFATVFFNKKKGDQALSSICKPASDRWRKRYVEAMKDLKQTTELLKRAKKSGDPVLIARLNDLFSISTENLSEDDVVSYVNSLQDRAGSQGPAPGPRNPPHPQRPRLRGVG